MATIGNLVTELTLTTQKYQRDFKDAELIATKGTRRIAQVLDQFGNVAFQSFERKQGSTFKDLERSMVSTAKSARAFAVPFASEIAPALGAVASRMISITTTAASVASGFNAIALAAVGLAGFLAGGLISAYQEAEKAQKAFNDALRTGDLAKTSAEIAKITEEITKLAQVREGAAKGGVQAFIADLRQGQAAQRSAALQRARDIAADQDAFRAGEESVPGLQTDEMLRRSDEARRRAIEQANDEMAEVLRRPSAAVEQVALAFAANDPLISAFRATLDAAAESLETFSGRLVPMTTILDQVGTAISDASLDLTDWDELARKAFEETRTPLERFAEAADQLEAMFSRGLITLDTYGRGIDKLTADYNKATKSVDDLIISLRQERDLLGATERERAVQNALLRAGAELTNEQAASIRSLVEESHDWKQMQKLADEQNRDLADGMTDLKDGARDFGHAIGTAFEDAILKGEKFGGVLEALLQDIARIGLRMAVTKPLEGLIGTGLNAVVGAFAGPSTVPSTSIHSAAEGGVFTRPSLTTIAEHGAEAAIPLDRWGELGGGGDVTVIVNNNAAPDTQARARESRGPNGERMVEVLVEKAVKDLTARGAFDSMNATNYGLRRRGAGR